MFSNKNLCNIWNNVFDEVGVIQANDLANGWTLDDYLNYSRSSLVGQEWRMGGNKYSTNQCVEPSNSSSDAEGGQRIIQLLI